MWGKTIVSCHSCRLFPIPKEVKIWHFKYILLLIIVTNFYFWFDCMNFYLASHLKTRTTMAGTRFDDSSSNSIDINNLVLSIIVQMYEREQCWASAHLANKFMYCCALVIANWTYCRWKKIIFLYNHVNDVEITNLGDKSILCLCSINKAKSHSWIILKNHISIGIAEENLWCVNIQWLTSGWQ